MQPQRVSYACPTGISYANRTCPDLPKRVEAHSLVEDILVDELRVGERALVQGREHGECMRTAAHD